MNKPFCCMTDANKLKEELLEVSHSCNASYDETNALLSRYHFPKLTERQYVEHMEYLDRQAV